MAMARSSFRHDVSWVFEPVGLRLWQGRPPDVREASSGRDLILQSVAEDKMALTPPLRVFEVDKATVEIYPSKLELGEAAAAEAASILKSAVSTQGRARVIVATGNSQEEVIRALAHAPGVDWPRVEVLHMDEYVGLPSTHPASFRRWVETHLVALVHPGQVHYLQGDASDLVEECRRYAGLIRSSPVDLCLLGIGENGHIAFNDPHVADFNDPLVVKRVDLDRRCRLQQVGEGHFAALDAVPREALTLTCSALMSSERLVCSVPELRKAEAVRDALEGPVSTVCPGSVLRTHPRARIFLDEESAALLSLKR
jgi:glucosamine-6-phosphate deaminase